MSQAVDNVALLPAYLAAATAVLVLLADLLLARCGVTLAVAVGGATATAVAATASAAGPPRGTFCVRPADDGAAMAPTVETACSYVADGRAALVAVVVALLTAAVLALSAPMLRAGAVPAGEYCFLLACSMTGGVVLGAARDVITVIVALETLTLPLYVLVGLRRRVRAGAEAAVTFFVVSVVATAITLLGAALLYAATGALHLELLAHATVDETTGRLARVAVALLVAGLAFKIAALPAHAWAPTSYDGAPLPVAAYLSTASKLGGVVAILAVVVEALTPWAAFSGAVLAVLAVLTMTVGNLVALRQTRMVRLLAWSSIAQAGYILAPLGAAVAAAGRTERAYAVAVTAALGYAIFYVILELTAFAAVVALRAPGDDGGLIAEYRGAARRHPWVGAVFVLALVGLAGLPPGLAGLFAKVTVVRSLLDGGAAWIALAVAVNTVIGLAYYVRVAAALYADADHAHPPSAHPRPAASPPAGSPAAPPRPRVAWPVAAALGGAALVALIVGFAPQLVLTAAGW